MSKLLKDEERQVEALEKLARMIGNEKLDGRRALRELRRLEGITHREVEDYCNGVISTARFGSKQTDARKRVCKILGGEVPGLKIDGDPRGYAVKIEDSVERGTL